MFPEKMFSIWLPEAKIIPTVGKFCDFFIKSLIFGPKAPEFGISKCFGVENQFRMVLDTNFVI